MHFPVDSVNVSPKETSRRFQLSDIASMQYRLMSIARMLRVYVRLERNAASMLKCNFLSSF